MTEQQPQQSNNNNGEVPLVVWAWEFLRRRDDYKEAYDKYSGEAEVYKKEHGENWNSVVIDYDPPIKGGDSHNEFPKIEFISSKLQHFLDWHENFKEETIKKEEREQERQEKERRWELEEPERERKRQQDIIDRQEEITRKKKEEEENQKKW